MSERTLAHASPLVVDESTDALVPAFDDRPPGERYYRHPGDVVRLVVWGAVTLALVLFVEVATDTSDGLRDDLGRASTSIAETARELILAVVQVAALAVPLAVVTALVMASRWRRLVIVLSAAGVGAAVVAGLDTWLDLSGAVPGALGDDSWLVSTRFPSLPYVGGAMAALMVGKPWLSRQWRRAGDRALVVLAVVVAIAGVAGAPEVLLTVAAGGLVGAAVLVAVGAPNRNPAPMAVAAALRDGGVDIVELDLERAVGGRAQLYRATVTSGEPAYVKVYGRDSRDADVLYRGYRRAMLREAGDAWPTVAVERDVEHEALMLLLAGNCGVRCPQIRSVVTLPDGSAALAMEYVNGRRLDVVPPEEISVALLEAVWGEVARFHRSGFAHRALRAANVLVDGDTERPVLIDLGVAVASAPPRAKAIDRAELLVSLANVVGAERAVDAAGRVLDRDELAATLPYLQPLALSAATRKQASKSALKQLREAVGTAAGEEQPALEPMVRVRARTVILILTLAGAFYVLLPQLANVDESFDAIRSAEWGWLAGAVVLSILTYFGAAVAMAGGVATRLPVFETLLAQLASSFVNRVTPAKVGGLALNVRYLQKAGVEPAAAVTGIGLNVAAGAIVHMLLLVVFFAWAGQDSGGFSIPTSSTALVIVLAVLVVLGLVSITRWGQRFVRKHVVRFVKQSVASIVALAKSPGRLAALIGGSLAVTLAYIGALVCSVFAFDGGMSFAQVGAVYLGASVIAAAAPTPGGLGAVEAAFVAGFTALDMDPAIAVAAVLSYRLATFWLPIVPGWLCFQLLQRRGFV